jgi:hypothetical protein
MTTVNLLALVGLGVALGAATSGVAMTLVDGADAPTSSAVLSGDVTLAECAHAMPAAALDLLRLTGPPVLGAGDSCEAQLGTKELAVSRRALLSGGSAADLPVAALQSFEIACALLVDPDGVIERSPDWLGAQGPSCTRTAADGRGVSEVVLLTEADSVVEMRLFQTELPSVDVLHRGLASLAASAEDTW